MEKEPASPADPEGVRSAHPRELLFPPSPFAAGRPNSSFTLTPFPAFWPGALPQPRLASRPGDRRLRRHTEEARRELRGWSSGTGSGSGSNSGSRSSEGSGSDVGHGGGMGPRPLSWTRGH